MWQYQMLFLIYRWIIAIFFVVEIGVIGYEIRGVGAKYFIYLTNLGFTLLTLYTLWSAVSVTVRFFQVHVFCRNEVDGLDMHPSMLEEHVPRGCCQTAANTLTWYQMGQWLLYTLAVEVALGITLLFWSLLYKPGHDALFFTHENLVPHLINGITAFLETWISGVPVRLLHFIYPVTFGAGYIVFTGIYYAANGTNPNGSHSIYPVLDYENKLGFAVGVDLITVFVLAPLLHMLLFAQFLVKSSLVNWVRKHLRMYWITTVTTYHVVQEDPVPELEDERHDFV